MKKIYLLVLVFISQFAFAQTNLVGNPSFEFYSSCPTSLGQMSNATDWVSSRNTPDYFNTCAPTSTEISIPSNGFGYHYPLSGNAYAGFWAKDETSEYREHLGIPLITTLLINTRYYVSFKVSLSTSRYPFHEYCGVNKLGVLFSTVNYLTPSDPSPINNYAQIYTDSIITDTLNWVTIKGSFVADSSYSFLSIGNFFNNSLTDSIQIEGSRCLAYYYLDDICVSTDSAYCFNYTYIGIKENNNPLNLSIYPNPAIDYINIDFPFLNEPYTITIYDMLGREMFLKQKVVNPIEHIPIDNLHSDILFIKITSKNRTFNCKIIKL